MGPLENTSLAPQESLACSLSNREPEKGFELEHAACRDWDRVGTTWGKTRTPEDQGQLRGLGHTWS